MPARLACLLLAALALVLAACGGDSGDGKAKGAATKASASDQSGCRQVQAPQPKGDQQIPKPTLKLDRGKTYTAKVKTSCGEFDIRLDVKRAPKTSASFAYLAGKKFFDGLAFHRIVPGFVIQGGDPKGDGSGGPGYSVTEAPPKDLQYTRGVVAMAKTGTEPAGTSGSQFFVVTGEDVGLPPDYALLGDVSAGQDVVDAIGTVQTNPSTEAPVDPVVIESITIAES